MQSKRNKTAMRSISWFDSCLLQILVEGINDCFKKLKINHTKIADASAFSVGRSVYFNRAGSFVYSV
jgi:hypothetical protein